MLGKIFHTISSFFMKRPLFYALALVICGVVFYAGISRINIDGNIYSIFPKGKQYNEFSKILKENNFNKQVIFSIVPTTDDTDLIKESLDSIAKAIQSKTGGMITNIIVARDSQEEEVLNHVFRNFPALIDSAYYSTIEGKIKPDSIRKSLNRVNERLASGNALFYQRFLARDPLGISYKYLNSIRPQDDSNAIQLEDGILYSRNHERVLFLGSLDFESSDNAKNHALNVALTELKTNLKAVDFDYFGTFQIADENAQQVQKDTSLTLYISVGLILLILVIYYKSFLTPLYFILPVIFGGCAGLAMAGFIKPSISAISMATSSVLLGIIINYSFHFFTHYKHSGSLATTIKELSFPMIVGSFTTVAAFAALLFTDSVILQDFGLIALFSLTGAALFTLILLPPIIHFTGFKFKDAGHSEEKSVRIPTWVARTGIFIVLILTVVFALNSGRMSFDDDLNNLGFHSDELAKKENYFTGIDPRTEKKIHFFTTGKTKEDALEANADLFHKLNKFKQEKGLEEIISCAPFCVSEKQATDGFTHWQHFWSVRKTSVIAEVAHVSDSLQFASTAFQPFGEWISTTHYEPEKSDLLAATGLSNLIYERNGEWTIVTSIVVKKSQLADFKANFGHLDQVFLMDIADMAATILSSVRQDFNYLLIFSSLIVFLSLWLVYGRIELALFSFFPMVVSWVWILGISGLFGVQFNFVNIVIATFIFGLGDDFSIFVTDGLLQKLKYNTNVFQSYRGAIILSAITTIIGTGALIFAKHPAIYSISIISVVGIGCVLLVTLLIQPAIFNFFVTNRISRKKAPVTFFNLVWSIGLFTYFFIGCLLMNLFLTGLIFVPIRKKTKRSILNFLVSKMTKSTIYLGLHIRKVIINKEQLDFSRPSIIIANHSSFLDILLMLMLNPKVIIVVKAWVYNSPFFGLFIRHCGYLFVSEGMEHNMEQAKERIAEGYSIVIFPEGSRSKDGIIKRFHKGAFYLAEQLHLDIQPILILGASSVNSRNDFMIRNGHLILKVLPRVPYQPENDYRSQTKRLNASMRTEFDQLKKDVCHTEYLWPFILNNFVYKGPVIEWYLRVKWGFERANYEEYDRLIADRKQIADLGCGYGFLDYYLHYRDGSRNIIGIDYDEDKIAVAQNGYDKTEQLQFAAGDIRGLDLRNMDVIILNDVLHYLEPEDQWTVLANFANQLNENGIIILRDGIKELENRHAVTRFTEYLSTRLFRFNKTSNQLNFFSAAEIHTFAAQHQLHVDYREQSKNTSNVLFILTRNHSL